jgi:dodecin
MHAVAAAEAAAEIMKLDTKVENGKVIAYRARVSLSFKYED